MEFNRSHALELSRESDYSVALMQANPYCKVCITSSMLMFSVLLLISRRCHVVHRLQQRPKEDLPHHYNGHLASLMTEIPIYAQSQIRSLGCYLHRVYIYFRLRNFYDM